MPSRRGFCPTYGTPLTFRYVETPNVCVTLGSLDHPERVPVREQFGVEGRQAWLDELDSIPGSTTDGDMSAEQQARLVNYQHPDRDI